MVMNMEYKQIGVRNRVFEKSEEYQLDTFVGESQYDNQESPQNLILQLEQAIWLTSLKEIDTVAPIKFNRDELKAYHDYLFQTQERYFCVLVSS